MDTPDIVVVGGGVVAAACARALGRRALGVTMVAGDGEAGAATPAAAGILAPLVRTHTEEPLLSLSVGARDLYHTLAPSLLEATGINIGLWTEGILQIAFSEEESTLLKGVIAWQRQQGHNADWLSHEDLRERAPGISTEAIGAMLAPEDGALEPVRLHDALLADAERSGVTITRDRVERVSIADGRVTGVVTGSGEMPAAHVVVAAGAWSGRIGGLPRPLSVEPIRGQMTALPWPAGEPHAIVFSGSAYVVHRDREALAGSTMEHVGFDASTTADGQDAITREAHRIYPALEGAKVLRGWSGLRPVSPDGVPIVGPDPGVEGLWYATGHGRNGILLAGLTGEIVARLLVGEPVEHDVRPMDPGRFWRL